MKIKYSIIAVVIFLLLVSLTQIFNIPPFNRDVYPLYKSGYFHELDREFRIIADSFISIKTMSRPLYAWIYLQYLSKKHDIRVEVFDRLGHEVSAPGRYESVTDPDIQRVLRTLDPKPVYTVNKSTYSAIIPMISEDRCGFCHKKVNNNGSIGAFVFSRPFDGHVYYTGERMILFSVISLVLVFFLILLIRWDPEKNIKELFDKS